MSAATAPPAPVIGRHTAPASASGAAKGSIWTGGRPSRSGIRAMSDHEYADAAEHMAHLRARLRDAEGTAETFRTLAGQQDKERALWCRRAADLSSSLRALVHNYEALLSELEHHGHETQTDPDTMCLDCYGLREAKAALEWKAPQ